MTDQDDDKMREDLFGFLSANLDDLARCEVQDELRDRGIDMSRAFKRIGAALETAKARAALEEARIARPTVVAKLQSVITGATTDISGQIRILIERRVDRPLQPVFMNKLKSAATEDDLKSLLDDLKRLDELAKDAENEGTSH